MTTAREQALEAAVSLDHEGQGMSWWEAKVQAANAASDVWEPLLVEAVTVINGLADQQAMTDLWYEDFLARAKEALGQ